MLTSYISFSGVEIANADRFKSYMDGGLGGGTRVADCGCSTLTYPDPGPYTLPDAAGFEAPWYDPTRPESAHFAGVIVNRVRGLDAPYTKRTVTDSVIGGSLGALRLGARDIILDVTLWALDNMALEYGLEWWTSILSGRNSNAETFCHLGDLMFYAGCPVPDRGSECAGTGVAVVNQTGFDLERHMFSGGLVDGPRVTDRLVNRDREVVAYRITATLATESPYLSGALTASITDVALDVNAAVAAETWTCPEYVDPCPDVDLAPIPSVACASFVEQTCDWTSGGKDGPASWASQTWSATGEAVPSPDGDCTNMTLIRTGDENIDGCRRVSVRMLFGDATGGSGPITVEFTNTVGQGNINFALWNPATDQNLPITAFTRPAGSTASTFSPPTGDGYNISSTNSLGTHRLTFDVPAGTDPGTLYFMIWAFGGGYPGTPESEAITNIRMSYLDIPTAPECCTLDPGVPITSPSFSVPCWTEPANVHRTALSVANASQSTESGLTFAITNQDATTEIRHVRIAMYDPTLIGGTGTEQPPTVAGVWPLGGVQEWECAALVHEMFLPEIPAGTTIEVDGRKRRSVYYPTGQPENAKSAARYVYGGTEKPWSYQTLPPGKTYAVAVFADSAEMAPLSQLTVASAPLHLIAGSAA